MLECESIFNEYPEHLRVFKKNILREYIQYQILNSIYQSNYGKRIIFLGGTALRIIHDSTRFSEDLDFDNLDLTELDFTKLTDILAQDLENEGYQIEIKKVFRGAYHCYIKFPELLFQKGLSPFKAEKILIQLDAEPQSYQYIPDNIILNRFGIFRQIKSVPIGTLLSQKIAAALNRKQSKGRDFFDVVFLFSKTKPDFQYLQQKLDIGDLRTLKAAFFAKIGQVDLRRLAKDVEPFLMNNQERSRVILFKEFIERL